MWEAGFMKKGLFTVLLIFMLFLPLCPLGGTIVRAEDTSSNTWRDDFSYDSLEEMKEAGWNIGREDHTFLREGEVILDNDGTVGTYVLYSKIPSGIYNWIVESKGRWIDRSYGSLHVVAKTEKHTYAWWGDGYYHEFVFSRDGKKIYRIPGYNPKMNEWHRFTLKKEGNTLYMYFDGQLITTYEETDTAQSQLIIVGMYSSWIGRTAYDYILLKKLPTTQENQNASESKFLEQTLFFDDFESYSVGQFPSSGGWEVLYIGAGKEQQYVSDKYSKSGRKSFRLLGTTGWSAVVMKKFSSSATIIGFEFDILFKSKGEGYVDHPGFVCSDCKSWGQYWSVLFDHSNAIIYIKTDGGDIVLGSWEPKKWYHIKAIINKDTKTISVWINGVLKADNVKLPKDDWNTEDIQGIALTSAWPAQEVFYDNVRVFEMSSTPTETSPSLTKTQIRIFIHNAFSQPLSPRGGVFEVIIWNDKHSRIIANISTEYTRGNYKEIVTELPLGDYQMEVYNIPTTKKREFWGALNFTVSKTLDRIDFFRNEPFITGVTKYPDYPNVSTKPIPMVKNPGDTVKRIRLRVIVDHDETPPWDHVVETTGILIKQVEKPFLMPSMFIPPKIGSYKVRVLLYTLYRDKYVLTDQLDWQPFAEFNSTDVKIVFTPPYLFFLNSSACYKGWIVKDCNASVKRKNYNGGGSIVVMSKAVYGGKAFASGLCMMGDKFKAPKTDNYSFKAVLDINTIATILGFKGGVLAGEGASDGELYIVTSVRDLNTREIIYENITPLISIAYPEDIWEETLKDVRNDVLKDIKKELLQKTVEKNFAQIYGEEMAKEIASSITSAFRWITFAYSLVTGFYSVNQTINRTIEINYTIPLEERHEYIWLFYVYSSSGTAVLGAGVTSGSLIKTDFYLWNVSIIAQPQIIKNTIKTTNTKIKGSVTTRENTNKLDGSTKDTSENSICGLGIFLLLMLLSSLIPKKK
ncbi:hypothetical protein [Thermococcus gammatolerans]|uniref:Concanavalin A-related lectin/glucanase, putative n=1 Tax=Thermococcus gammatolerans (strain DSM 15229 / JCM 11827 / EJ3) TaxID=593117 RepID=C5A3R5_THEGJ|nr:hypothetical protein [Thermococcus gammatolerans]ACS32877.1 Concanavalin A-related lectin/glucanase, putative [Thermococcus gammatolerans EJ3]